MVRRGHQICDDRFNVGVVNVDQRNCGNPDACGDRIWHVGDRRAKPLSGQRLVRAAGGVGDEEFVATATSYCRCIPGLRAQDVSYRDESSVADRNAALPLSELRHTRMIGVSGSADRVIAISAALRGGVISTPLV